MLTETYKAVSSSFKQGMLAWDWPTNYVIIWCVPRKNRVMPSFGMTRSNLFFERFTYLFIVMPKVGITLFSRGRHDIPYTIIVCWPIPSQHSLFIGSLAHFTKYE